MRARYVEHTGRSTLRTLALILGLLLGAVLLGLLLLGTADLPPVITGLRGADTGDKLIGIIAGHWQSDSGAVCPDGLEEVDLNLAIARRVARLLRNSGYVVEVLPEYAPKLNGYEAAVLVSIHNDSCIYGVSGYKIARMTHSIVPEREDHLVNCLSDSYHQATGLEPHLNSITDDMREYHALRRIAPSTPGAIIECGFMGQDRHLLTQEQDRIATGIANGILAFLEEPDTP